MSRRRSPAAAGALGILVVLLATLSAFFLDSLPIIGAGATYNAEFSEAAGLKPTNEVRIAGVKVGQVTAVELEGDRVERPDRAVAGREAARARARRDEQRLPVVLTDPPQVAQAELAEPPELVTGLVGRRPRLVVARRPPDREVSTRSTARA